MNYVTLIALAVWTPYAGAAAWRRLSSRRITAGEGLSPAASDRVMTHCRGELIDGTVFRQLL